MLSCLFHQAETGLSAPSILGKRGRTALPPGGCRITSGGHEWPKSGEEWWAVTGSESRLWLVCWGGFCRLLNVILVVSFLLGHPQPRLVLF